MPDAALDLAALCASVAADLEEASAAPDGDTTAYARGRAAFARVAPAMLEVRLPADIAEAALRTPDTAAADERGWIRFTPRDAERHVTDRAEAWFRTAWRHAAER